MILGGGASGLICAIRAARFGLKVAILEHNELVGKKLLASGGGRCNFTNLEMSSDHFISENRHFTKSALARFNPSDFIEILNANDVEYIEEMEGQLFCKKTSKDIQSMLEKNARKLDIEIITSCEISSARYENYFTITTSLGEFESRKLVVATGGLSYKALGASEIGFKIAESFGHGITKLSPALTPIILGNDSPINFSELAGTSCFARVSTGKQIFTNDILFTHRGLSGPAILQISSYWSSGKAIFLDLLPELNILEELKSMRDLGNGLTPKKILSEHLPRKLARELTRDLEEKRIDQHSNRELEIIAKRIHNLKIIPKGTADYEKAEVTRGGIKTDKISSKNMESRIIPGLFFIGEVIDVTGKLGGYNLHWAWASGWACGESLARAL